MAVILICVLPYINSFISYFILTVLSYVKIFSPSNILALTAEIRLCYNYVSSHKRQTQPSGINWLSESCDNTSN